MFEDLASGIVGIGMENAAVVGIHPRDDSGAAVGGGARVDAFEDRAGLAVAQFAPQHTLPGPIEEFQAKIGHPKIRAGERDHGLIAGQSNGGGVCGAGRGGLDQVVLVGRLPGMDHRQHLSGSALGREGLIDAHHVG